MSNWKVLFHDAFVEEFLAFEPEVRKSLASYKATLQQEGHQLGRPHVDTLNGSKHANMKELRFKADNGVWRVAFAFDPKRQAILLVGGDKSGGSEKRFYRDLIKKADERFDEWIEQLEKE